MMNFKSLIATALIAAASINVNAAYIKTGTVVKADANAMTLSVKDSKTQEITEYKNVPASIKIKVAGINTEYTLADLKEGERVKLAFSSK